jgi:2-polyprenyl-3-methyl-5-hydroxy-6-metoxy-1,4-benzoquinol methylase
MRPTCLDLLRCSRCQDHPLILRVEARTDSEVREGQLRCGRCGTTFSITRGVVEMMHDASEQVREEIESIDSWLPEVDRLTPLNDEWLIGLPFTFHKGAESDIAVNLPRLLEAVDPQPGKQVLEVGAGTTWLSNLLAREGCTVVATDVVRRLYVGLDSADVLMHRSGTVFDRVVAEMDRVPCVDEAFDIVVANAVFHHSSNLTETFREMRRLLRSGGKMVLVEPMVGPLNLSGKAYMARLNADGLGDQAYTPWAFTRSARAAGFRCRLSIARSVDQRFLRLRDDADYKGNRSLKYRLARYGAGILRMPVMGGLARAVLYPAALYLLGLTCIIVAEPNNGARGLPS